MSAKKQRLQSPVHDTGGNPILKAIASPAYIDLIKEHTQLYPGPYLKYNAERKVYIQGIFKFVFETKIKNKYTIDESVAFLASHIFDCVMSKLEFEPSEVKTVAATCIFIACKNYHIWFRLKFLLQRFEHIGQPVDSAALLALEPKVMITCGYDMHIITSIDMTRAIGYEVHLTDYIMLKYLTRLFIFRRISPEGVEHSRAVPSLVVEACCNILNIELKKNYHKESAIEETASLIKHFLGTELEDEDSFLNEIYHTVLPHLREKKEMKKN